MLLLLFKPGTRPAAGHTWFLEIVLACTLVCLHVCVCVCVCVCPPQRPLITSGMIWCDIDCVQLVKQVLQLSVTLYDTCHLKMDGHGHINTARHERLPKKTKVTWY